MPTFLFWNLGGNPLTHRLARLVAHHEVDVLLLAECAIAPGELIGVLKREGLGWFHQVRIVPSKVLVFTRLDESALIEIYSHDSQRLAGYKLMLPDIPELLLMTAHLRSPTHESRDSLDQSATQWRFELRKLEKDQGHRRTIFVGDLNANPFDVGVTSAYGLHAVMTKTKALEQHRTLDGEDLPFFYNPMWRFFGDETPGPPGTYYRASNNAVNYFWNIYDQVLVRPDTLPFFDEPRILDHDGVESLLTRNGIPDRTSGSDHLPITFRIKEKE